MHEEPTPSNRGIIASSFDDQTDRASVVFVLAPKQHAEKWSLFLLCPSVGLWLSVQLEKPSLEIASSKLPDVYYWCYFFAVSNSGLLFRHVAGPGYSSFTLSLSAKKKHFSSYDRELWSVTLTYEPDLHMVTEMDVGPFFFTQPNPTHITNTRTQSNPPITCIREMPTPVLQNLYFYVSFISRISL